MIRHICDESDTWFLYKCSPFISDTGVGYHFVLPLFPTHVTYQGLCFAAVAHTCSLLCLWMVSWLTGLSVRGFLTNTSGQWPGKLTKNLQFGCRSSSKQIQFVAEYSLSYILVSHTHGVLSECKCFTPHTHTGTHMNVTPWINRLFKSWKGKVSTSYSHVNSLKTVRKTWASWRFDPCLWSVSPLGGSIYIPVETSDTWIPFMKQSLIAQCCKQHVLWWKGCDMGMI